MYDNEFETKENKLLADNDNDNVDTSLSTVCCNRPFLSEGTKASVDSMSTGPSDTVHRIGLSRHQFQTILALNKLCREQF